MNRNNKFLCALALASALPVAGCIGGEPADPIALAPPPATTLSAPLGEVVGMRRLTESQYRNAIADIFGPKIEVAGRFEPVVRPVHELLASGAAHASISPSGLEQFDAMARNIAAQVFAEEQRDRFVPCEPQDAAASDAACASATLTPLGRYIFRRPMTPEEQAFYVGLANEAVGPTGSFYQGLELALSAMLVSPHYLYVVERGEADPGDDGELQLDNYSRATSLSMMLWNTTPNERLLTLAEQGRLSDPKELSAVVDSMVNSRRFENGVRAFFSDMLLFEKFNEMAKDPVVYPYFNTQVASALPEQMLRTITDHVLTRDGDYRNLFTTSRTFMNRPLAALYRVQAAKSDWWVPFEFAPEDDRAGLLGQAGFLALYSHSGRSSPTLRGRAIRELLMCQPVPDPLGNVDFIAVQETESQTMPTARDRLTMHNENPVCAGCHSITDPVGLSLERFDGIGRFRATENNASIDVSGRMDGSSFEGAMGLGRTMAESSATTQCVASRALEYALGRPVDEDANRIEALERQFAGEGYRIRSLFRIIAASPDSYKVQSAPIGNTPTQVTLKAR